MKEFSTVRLHPALAGATAAVLFTACGGEPGDPRALYSESVASAQVTFPALEPVQAAVPRQGLVAMPAPLAERALAAPRTARAVQVAVGRTAVDLGAPEPAHLLPGDVYETVSTRAADRDAVEWMLLARADFAVVATPLSGRDQRAGLRQTTLGAEVFALAVASDNPLQSLSRDQMRRVLTGELRDWSALGLARAPLRVVVPNETLVATRAARALIPGDPFATDSLRAAGEAGVADLVRTEPGLVGVVRLGSAELAGVRLLPIDYVQPSNETWTYGTYPFGTGLHLVTSGPVDGPARVYLQRLQEQPAPAGLLPPPPASRRR